MTELSGGNSNRPLVEYTGDETRFSVPIYLCEDCTEELEEDILDEQNVATKVDNLASEGFVISVPGICSRELYSEIELLINDKAQWCHGGHEGGFGDDLVFGPEDTEHWDQVWERMKHVYEGIFDTMGMFRKEDPDR